MSTTKPGRNPSIARLSNAVRYLRALDEVEGWCDPTTALAMMELLWMQEGAGEEGGIAEIGIHHGKSFLALVAAARPSDRLLAIDLFERQAENVDASGSGDREAFLANLRRFFPAATVEVLAENSLDLWSGTRSHRLSGLRFLSIDGGHTRALTLNDLRLGDALLSPAGACVLGDVLSSHWTGVITGLFEFLAGSGSLIPFAILPNKMVLCRPAMRDRYAAWLRMAMAPALQKADSEFADHAVDVYGSVPIPLWTEHWMPPEAPVPARGDAAPDEAAIAGLQRELAALRSSTSWRVTAPLRALRSLGKPR